MNAKQARRNVQRAAAAKAEQDRKAEEVRKAEDLRYAEMGRAAATKDYFGYLAEIELISQQADKEQKFVVRKFYSNEAHGAAYIKAYNERMKALFEADGFHYFGETRNYYANCYEGLMNPEWVGSDYVRDGLYAEVTW